MISLPPLLLFGQVMECPVALPHPTHSLSSLALLHASFPFFCPLSILSLFRRHLWPRFVVVVVGVGEREGGERGAVPPPFVLLFGTCVNGPETVGEKEALLFLSLAMWGKGRGGKCSFRSHGHCRRRRRRPRWHLHSINLVPLKRRGEEIAKPTEG